MEPTSALPGLRWIDGKLKRHYADRQALLTAGAEVVTPIIEVANRIGPAAIVWGSHEEVNARMVNLRDEWIIERARLLAYGNRHPSEGVRDAAHQVEKKVVASFAATNWLFQTVHGGFRDGDGDAYQKAQERQNEAQAAATELMDLIRSY